MDCQQIQADFSAALDGELDATARAAVDQHLAHCPACREAWQNLQTLDAQIREATGPARLRAADIADAVTGQVRPVTLSRKLPHSRPRTALIATAAMAFGFLLAVLLLQFAGAPRDGARDGNNRPVMAELPPAPPPPAVIRIATGPLEYSNAAATPAVWNPVPTPDGFSCEPGASLRTPPDVVCELETANGSTVRMNAGTEICFQSAVDLELSQGEIWCRTPEAAALKVTAVEPGAPPTGLFSTTCGPSGPAICVFTCPTDAHPRITAAAGDVELKTSGTTERLEEGATVELRDGTVAQLSAFTDSALSQRWMHPLLVRKGPADPELFSRVDSLLAQVGHAKVSYLFERDLRSLGEYGALPLLRYVQSPKSQSEPGKREVAAEILADVAPAWMIPEMIVLLEDDAPNVRVHAAVALARLTDETHGVEPESWNEIGPEQMAALARWQEWWAAEKSAYPAPPPGVSAG